MTARTGDVIEQAAQVVADAIDEAYTFDGDLDVNVDTAVAHALADAGLLATQEPALPSRDEIARVVRQAIEDYYNSLPEAGDTYSEDDHITGAVLALLEGDDQ